MWFRKWVVGWNLNFQLTVLIRLFVHSARHSTAFGERFKREEFILKPTLFKFGDVISCLISPVVWIIRLQSSSHNRFTRNAESCFDSTRIQMSRSDGCISVACELGLGECRGSVRCEEGLDENEHNKCPFFASSKTRTQDIKSTQFIGRREKWHLIIRYFSMFYPLSPSEKITQSTHVGRLRYQREWHTQRKDTMMLYCRKCCRGETWRENRWRYYILH